MKKAVLIAVLLLALLLGGCKAKEQSNMEAADKSVTFINGVTEGDVWLLPKTQENLKTTVWGTAAAAKVKTGESRSVPLCEPGDGGLYLFRMIDTGQFYYSANDIELEDGYTLELRGDGLQEMQLEVKDRDGNPVNTYGVFAARL